MTALDGLLHAFDLEPIGDDRFRATCEPSRFDRIFGGQTVAQALLAASRTVTDKHPQSPHAYFAEAGAPDAATELTVERVRDGGSLATRRVSVGRPGRPLLTMIASFHTNPTEPAVTAPAPAVPVPEAWPTLQQWAQRAPSDLPPYARAREQRPRPVEMRIGEPPVFLGGSPDTGERSHWMRLPAAVGDDR